MTKNLNGLLVAMAALSAGNVIGQEKEKPPTAVIIGVTPREEPKAAVAIEFKVGKKADDGYTVTAVFANKALKPAAKSIVHAYGPDGAVSSQRTLTDDDSTYSVNFLPGMLVTEAKPGTFKVTTIPADCPNITKLELTDLSKAGAKGTVTFRTKATDDDKKLVEKSVRWGMSDFYGDDKFEIETVFTKLKGDEYTVEVKVKSKK